HRRGQVAVFSGDLSHRVPGRAEPGADQSVHGSGAAMELFIAHDAAGFHGGAHTVKRPDDRGAKKGDAGELRESDPERVPRSVRRADRIPQEHRATRAAGTPGEGPAGNGPAFEAPVPGRYR